jgi:hypothetical protein
MLETVIHAAYHPLVAVVMLPPGPATNSSQKFVPHLHVMLVSFVRVNNPVFVVLPLGETLPVPVQPVQTYWV